MDCLAGHFQNMNETSRHWFALSNTNYRMEFASHTGCSIENLYVVTLDPNGFIIGLNQPPSQQPAKLYNEIYLPIY